MKKCIVASLGLFAGLILDGCAGPDVQQVAEPKRLDACKNGDPRDKDCNQCVAYKMDISVHDWQEIYKGKSIPECFEHSDFKKAWKSCAGPDLQDKFAPPKTRNPCRNMLGSDECRSCLGYEMDVTYGQWYEYIAKLRNKTMYHTDRYVQAMIACGGRDHLFRETDRRRPNLSRRRRHGVV